MSERIVEWLSPPPLLPWLIRPGDDEQVLSVADNEEVGISGKVWSKMSEEN